MKIHELTPAADSNKAVKRIGRGPASGQGKTAGKGHKGQKARAGRGMRAGFEGGQMPLQRRLPKRGFNNIFRDVTVTVNGDEKTTNESLVRKVNKTLKENKALSETLTTVMAKLKEAAVVNHNLAQIVKLISENTTSQDEKKEIINRFASEAKTIEQSKNLYE